MISFVDITPADVISIVGEFKNGRKILLSNFFGVGNCEYGIFRAEDSLLIRKREFDFYRVYLLSSNIVESECILADLERDKYVINIPAKSGLGDWEQVFKCIDYKLLGEYRRYYNTKIKVRKSGIGEYAVNKDIESIESILNSNFSPYTDHLPSFTELTDMVENKQVLVTRDGNGEVLGILIYTLEGKKCYYNVWIDKSGNGLFLLYKAYNIVADKGIGYVYFWINSTNHDVIRLHQMMGAIPDGLVDYTFINK